MTIHLDRPPAQAEPDAQDAPTTRARAGSPEDPLTAAVIELLARRAGTSRVAGSYVRALTTGNGWRPNDPRERQACCARAYVSGSLGVRAHFKGAEHVAHLYGVDPQELADTAKATARKS